MSLSQSLPLALAALVLEALVGYPAPLYRAIGHPVTWMGAWLAWLEARLNRPGASFAARRALGRRSRSSSISRRSRSSRWRGDALCSLRRGALRLRARSPLLAASLPAQRSLDAHVRAVADGLDEASRRAGARSR